MGSRSRGSETLLWPVGGSPQTLRSQVGQESSPTLYWLSCLKSGEGNGNPLQYSCLENPMDRGAWRATKQTPGDSEGQGGLACCSPWGLKESDTTE